VTRSLSLPTATDDTAAIARTAMALLLRVDFPDKIRLGGIQAHQLERVDCAQFDLFDGWQMQAARASRLNRALDSVTARFGEAAVTRGLVRAERAGPSRRIK
jgi:hypothetical protein